MSVNNHGGRKRDEHAVNTASHVPPPDGGWGWVIVFGSFMIHIITDGVTYSFGVFYDEFLEYFEEGKAATSWILSILVGVTLCSGPLSSLFVNRWGCRKVTIVGSILAALCMISSIFAKNVTTLYFSIGMGTGFGFGLIYLPAIVSVTTYFEKRRSLATGIAVCGSGFGTFIFAPIITKLLQEYGWRGAMLIIAGIVLECILFGALFRPLKPKKRTNVRKQEAELDLHIKSEHLLNVPTANRPLSMGYFSSGSVQLLQDQDAIESSRLTLSQPVLAHKTEHFDLLSKPDIFYQGSLMNIPSYKSLELKIFDSDRRFSFAKQEDATCWEETKVTMHKMMDFSLFKDWIFILFILSNFLTSIGFNIPYVYIVPKAKTMSLTSEQGSLLLSVIGIANTFGRIVLGYVSDKAFVNRLLVYNWCLTLCGLSTILSAFCTSFMTLVIYACVFGFTIGAYVGLTSVILVDLLGLEKLTSAFGILLLFQGLASLIGPPIAGILYDVMLSYNPGFYLAGITIAFSGVVLFLIPPLQRCSNRNEEKNRKTTVST